MIEYKKVDEQFLKDLSTSAVKELLSIAHK